MSECKEYLVTYTGKGGLELQRKWANEVFVVGQQYKVTYGIIYDSYTLLYFEGISGGYNSVLFDSSEEDIYDWDCIEHDY